MRHLPLLLAVVAVSCGRTGALQPGVTESPLFVFKGSICPMTGIEADLTPEKSDGLALVQMTAQGECSGAGGEYLIGRELGSTRDFFVGDHACYFHPMALQPAPAGYFAVVRYSQTAAIFHAPMGWCISNANGKEPVTTDSKSLAWGVFQTEAGARAMYERLESTR